jgi:hypothetical protein
MRRTSRLFIAALFAPLVSACSVGEPTIPDGLLDPSGPDNPALGWIADYFGNGAGQVDGQPFEVRDAALRIALDADSVRLPSCPTCVTVVLDSVFALANVAMTHPTEVEGAYDDRPVRYTLALLRFSSNGGLGNAVSARATMGNAGVPTPFFDVTYLLERP